LRHRDHQAAGGSQCIAAEPALCLCHASAFGPCARIRQHDRCGLVGGPQSRSAAFGPVGLEALAQAYWESNRADIEIRIPDEGKPDPRKLLVVKDITGPGPVLGNDKVKVTAFRTPHPPILERNYAYKFETPDGVIVYACDTAYNPELAKFAAGADLLIHEALYLPAVDSMTSRIKNASTLKEHLLASHTSTEDVGRVAKAAGVRKLVMSHLVPGDDPDITDEMWMEGARKHYDGPIVVARDLMQIDL
jgi:ribonuclease BN (tRNA processing enzyme)